MVHHDYIEYNNKVYQLSFFCVNDTYELMVFPIENGVVSGNEVYCHRTTDFNNVMDLYNLILNNPSSYLNQKIIDEYLNSKEEDFKITDLQRYKNFFDEINIDFVERHFQAKNKSPVTILSICDKHYNPKIYGACIDIIFDKNTEKFVCFEPSGE